MRDATRIASEIHEQGYSIAHEALSEPFLARARPQLARAIEQDLRRRQKPADHGMVLLCALYGGAFLELFDEPKAIDPFDEVLGPGNIVYSYTSSSMPPRSGNYSSRIHVDCPRLIPGYVTNVGATFLVDDFTEENGATWYLPGSHLRAEPPAEEEFRRDAKRLVAKAGTAFFFNARLWHSGGTNRTDRWRHALTLNMCRPFMKQRIDIPRALREADLSGASQRALQKLGFFSQPPASYAEYDAPPAERTFRQPTE